MGKSNVLHLKPKHPDQKASFDRIDAADLTLTWPPGKKEPVDTELQKATAADKKEWDAMLQSYHLLHPQCPKFAVFPGYPARRYAS